MHKSLISLLLLLLAAPALAEEARKLESEIFPGEAGLVHIDLSFGSLTVEGSDEPNVRAEVVIECGREDLEKCKQRAQRIRIRPRVKKGALVVKLKNTPRGRVQGLKAAMRVWVPRELPLDVNVRGGGVWVGGMKSHVEIDSFSGDVDLTHEHDRVRSVDVDVAFGKADLWIPGGRIQGSGFPRSLNWHGPGEAKLNVDVGTGDVAVRLE